MFNRQAQLTEEAYKMEYLDNYQPTKKDLRRLQEYFTNLPIKEMPREIKESIEQKRATEKQQRNLSLLIG